jgi:hypothetical protein
MEQKEVAIFFDLNIKYLQDFFGISYADGVIFRGTAC